VLDLLQELEDPDSLKELKTMPGNCSWGDFLSVLEDIQGRARTGAATFDHH
jgi:hypothetical protein